MEVITFVEGMVPESKIKEFKAGYETLKEETKPDGLIASYLLQDSRRSYSLLKRCGKVWKL